MRVVLRHLVSRNLLTLTVLLSIALLWVSSPARGTSDQAQQPSTAIQPLDRSWLQATLQDGMPTLSAIVPSGVLHSVSYLETPKRLVIDLTRARLAMPSATLELEWQIATRCRVFQHLPDCVRIVLDLKLPVRFDIERSTHAERKDKLTVRPANSVTSLDVGPDDGVLGPLRAGVAVIKLQLSGPFEYSSFSLQVPDRLVIDIPRAWASLEGTSTKGWGPVKLVKFSSAEGCTRVVFDLAGPMGLVFEKQTGSNILLVYLYPRVTSLTVTQSAANFEETMVIFRTSYPMSEGSVSVWSSGIGDTAEGSLRVCLAGIAWAYTDSYSGLLDEDIAVESFVNSVNGVGNEDYAEIAINLFTPCRYTWRLSGDGKAVEVTLTRLPMAQKWVIIDPGHGGKDPGAIGKAGISEKSIVLSIASSVAAMLRDIGILVTLTRDSDEWLSLSERTVCGMGGEALPDAFVSLHVNAFTTAKPSGTETFYSKTSHPASESLGLHIQTSVVAALRLPNRGLKVNEALIVTRGRPIPSVLHEIAFISNPIDEALLIDAKWQTVIAKAIKDGIVRFLMEVSD